VIWERLGWDLGKTGLERLGWKDWAGNKRKRNKRNKRERNDGAAKSG
jgi:hypothetical protein